MAHRASPFPPRVGGAPCDCDSGARLVDLAVVGPAALCQQPSCAAHSGTRCRTRRGPAPRRPSGSQRTTAPGMLRGMGTHQAANRSAWTDFAPAYAVAAERQWAATEPTWGTVGRPERELGLLGDVRGLERMDRAEAGEPAEGPGSRRRRNSTCSPAGRQPCTGTTPPAAAPTAVHEADGRP